MVDESVAHWHRASEFRVSTILENTFSIIFSRFIPFYAASLIMTAPLLWFFYNSIENDVDMYNFAGMMVGIFLLGAICQPILMYATFQQIRRQRVSLQQSITIGFSRAMPVLGVAVLGAIGQIFGFVLLIIPGVILAAMWFVALPVCVVEKTGIQKSFARSVELTNDFRWKIFGIMATIGIADNLVSKLIEVAAAGMGDPMVMIWSNYFWTSFVLCLHSVLPSVIYHRLRFAKEGMDIDRIVRQFE